MGQKKEEIAEPGAEPAKMLGEALSGAPVVQDVLFQVCEYLSLCITISSCKVSFLIIETCKTTEGKKCVFPFRMDGKEYNECTWDYAFES